LKTFPFSIKQKQISRHFEKNRRSAQNDPCASNIVLVLQNDIFKRKTQAAIEYLCLGILSFSLGYLTCSIFVETSV